MTSMPNDFYFFYSTMVGFASGCKTGNSNLCISVLEYIPYLGPQPSD